MEGHIPKFCIILCTKLKSYIQAFKDFELHNRSLNHYCNLFSPDFLGKKGDLKKQYVLTQKCQKHSLQRHGHFVGGFIHDKAINQPPWTIEKRANGSDNGQKMVVVNKSLSKGLVQRSNNLKNSNFYKQILGRLCHIKVILSFISQSFVTAKFFKVNTYFFSHPFFVWIASD